MSKLTLNLIGFFSMVLAIGIAFLIMINDGGFWSFVPMILWFVLGQIFIVPKILKKKD